MIKKKEEKVMRVCFQIPTKTAGKIQAAATEKNKKKKKMHIQCMETTEASTLLQPSTA